MYAIGVDIGGTNTKVGLVSSKQGIVKQHSFSTTAFHRIEDFVEHLIEVIDKSLVSQEDAFVGIGIGAPGADTFSGAVKVAVNLNWDASYSITNHLSRHYGKPVHLVNDADASGLGEYQFGVGKGVQNLFCVTLGTGVGGAVILNGKILAGLNHLSGELGHMRVADVDRQCNCGKVGCLDTYVSATGLKRTVYQLLATSVQESGLRKISYNDMEAATVASLASKGDMLANSVFEFTGRKLGEKLVDIVGILDPELIVIAGGLAAAGDLLFDPVRNALRDNLSNFYAKVPAVVPSQFSGAESSILGAASLVL